jgi:hypothetical protein
VTISIVLSACGSLDERLSRASTEKAVAESSTSLPDLPPKCREKMRRIALQEGEEWFAVQVRWMTAAEEQDARTALCANFYENVKSKFGSRP